VSRWDTCAAEAILGAHGGVLCKLRGAPTRARYAYRQSNAAGNQDFEPGLAVLTDRNCADPAAFDRQAPPARAEAVEQVGAAVGRAAQSTVDSWCVVKLGLGRARPW
jgi:hypothetical protein